MTDTEKGDNNAVKPSDKFYMNIDYVGNCPVCKKHGHVMTRCTECLGKDNSGMGPLDKEETINFLWVVLQTAWIKYKNLFGEQPHGTQKQLLAMLEFCIEEICANFSQQPPKGHLMNAVKKARLPEKETIFNIVYKELNDQSLSTALIAKRITEAYLEEVKRMNQIN